MNSWFWLVVAIASVLFVVLVGVGIWLVHFFSHFMDGF